MRGRSPLALVGHPSSSNPQDSSGKIAAYRAPIGRRTPTTHAAAFMLTELELSSTASERRIVGDANQSFAKRKYDE